MKKLNKCFQTPYLLILLTILLSTTMNAEVFSLPQIAGTDDESGAWYMVAQFANGDEEIIPMIEVGSLVAIDDAYDFSVLDAFGSVMYEGVIKVFFKTAAELNPTAIRSITSSQNILGRAVDGKLTLIGVSDEITIFDSVGKKQFSTAATGGETIINIAHLPAGVYIVKCGKQSFKFTKK